MSPLKLNVYVIHVENFNFRKQTCERLREILAADDRYELHFQYVTEHEPQSITQEDIRTFVNYEPFKDDPFTPFNNFIRNMHVNQLSNELKHRKAIQYVSESEDGSMNIILEDDIVFNENVADALYHALTNIPESSDIMFLGLPSAVEGDASTVTHQKVSEVFKFLPACDSYYLTKSAAKTMFENMTPIKFTTTIQFTYVISRQGLTAHLTVPNVFVDGSKLGLYFSSLEVNNRLIFNQEYVKLARMIGEKESYTPEDIDAINQEFINVKLKTNPEFYYLKAIYEYKRQNYEFAKAIYGYALEIYENNGAIINNQSTFLRDYMRVFKHLQPV